MNQDRTENRFTSLFHALETQGRTIETVIKNICPIREVVNDVDPYDYPPLEELMRTYETHSSLDYLPLDWPHVLRVSAADPNNLTISGIHAGMLEAVYRQQFHAYLDHRLATLSRSIAERCSDLGISKPDVLHTDTGYHVAFAIDFDAGEER